MERKSVNPWSWSEEMGFNQAQLVEDTPGAHLRRPDIVTPTATHSTPATWPPQARIGVNNLEAVLAGAEMTHCQRRPAEHLHDRHGHPAPALQS